MRDKILFSISVVMLLASLGYFFMKKYHTAAGKAPVENPVDFSFREYNLGPVKKDSLYPVNFPFKGNEHLQAAQSINFEPSCGCTLLRGNRSKLLQKNVHDTLKVILNTQGKKGPFEVEIAVKDTALNMVGMLKIKGNAE